MSAAMQHSSEPPVMQIAVYHFDFGDIKLLKEPLSRCYYCHASQGGFLYLRHTGISNYDEIMRYTVHLVKDESWMNGAKLFSDFRWLDNRESSFDSHYQLAKDIESLYEKNGRYLGDGMTLCSDDFEFGMHRMFQSILDAEVHSLNTVRDFDTAVKLLGIDRELVDQVIAEVDKIEALESA